MNIITAGIFLNTFKIISNWKCDIGINIIVTKEALFLKLGIVQHNEILFRNEKFPFQIVFFV